MTALSQEILDHYQVRKTKKQKQAFAALLLAHFPELQIQEGGFPRNRNLILGDIEKAKVLLTAHYDTCARLPFPNFIAPKNIFLTLLYSFIIIIPILLANTLLQALLGLVTDDFWIHYWSSLLVVFGLLFLLVAGPANKHTANDNTSGVITLCELIAALTPQVRENVAFIFFDNEENGLLGASYFRKCYKKAVQNKLLINFDCVSDGDNILVAVSKDAQQDAGAAIADSYQASAGKQILLEKAEKVYYPSDQAVFRKTVAVAALKHKRVIGYYMDRIHTNQDTVFDEENIRLLTSCTKALIDTFI